MLGHSLGSYNDISRVSGVLLGSGLALTTATQLRLAGIPFGVGESLLLGVVAWSFLNMALYGRSRLSGGAFAMLQTWICLICSLAAGWLVGLLAGRWNVLSGPRDAVAYLFSFLVIMSFITLPNLEKRIFLAIKAMIVVASVGLGFLLAISVISSQTSFSVITPWTGIRFVGWAMNPNQIAFLIGSIPFIAYFFLQQANRRSERLAATMILAISVVIGVATLSDALLVGWLVSISGMVLIWVLGTERPALFSFKVLIKISLLSLLIIGVAIIFLSIIQSSVSNMMVEEQGQAHTRFVLWRNGISSFLDSPLVGFGPGSYSWATDPRDLTEAHNTFIDLAASAGILGLAPVLVLIGVAMYRSFRVRDAGLFGCMLYVCVFCSFHFLLRHPIFWFLILFVLLMSRRGKENNRFVVDG